MAVPRPAAVHQATSICSGKATVWRQLTPINSVLDGNPLCHVHETSLCVIVLLWQLAIALVLATSDLLCHLHNSQADSPLRSHILYYNIVVLLSFLLSHPSQTPLGETIKTVCFHPQFPFIP